jgi:VWFA-related protein
VPTSLRVATIAVTLGLSAWSAAQSAAPPRPSPTSSQPGQTTDAPPPASPAQAQGDRPVFRGGVELIQLDVSVLDRKRQPVTGLNASDFTVFENGVQRPVRAFTSVKLPARRSGARADLPAAAPVDVVTNQVGEQEGRLLIILMDRTIPTGQPTMVARKVATAAVEALGPYDLGALVSTSGSVPQNLTADRSRLLHAINEPRDWSTGHSKELKDVMVLPDDPLSDGRCLCGLCVLETLTRIADAVQNTPRRRKVLLFIGSSVIFQVGPRAPSLDVGCDYRVNDARLKLFGSLALSNLTVHSIDPSGLVTLGPQTRAGAPGGKPGEDAPVVRRQKMQAEFSELLRDQGSLQVLPDLTGGRAVLNTNAPEEKVPEIFGETDAYYLIGFEPGTPDRRDHTRSIEVKVARTDVRVYTQRQFMARAVEKASSVVVPRGANAPISLEQALRGLLPNASRPLTLSVAAFAGSNMGKAIVMVNIDVGAFANARETAMPLEFAVSAVNQVGRQVAFAREAATVTFKPGTPTRRAEANVQTHMELTPGDYEVRVAVSDPATGVAASVFCPVAVPLFGKAPLSLSDVMVETTGGTATLPASESPVPMATTRRVFEQNESVRALVQVYQGTQRTDGIAPVSVRTTILDAKGRAIRDQLLALAVKDFTNRRAALALDIGQLPPGEYVLNIDASLERQKTSRIVPFAVQ